jgi:regulatory protein YycH of two-component signal transduction system YycFG
MATLIPNEHAMKLLEVTFVRSGDAVSEERRPKLRSDHHTVRTGYKTVEGWSEVRS